jgi:regulator of protease activity HflC (stomatin/prohibitin superfamily)
MNKVSIPQGFCGILYEKEIFVEVLSPGIHKLKKHFFDGTVRKVVRVDQRERSLTIKNQEILTADKVAIRVSLIVYFRVKDPAAALHNVESYEERIYEDVQLAARRFLANRSLDAILTDRNEISDAVRDDVREAALGYGVEIARADVKDLVFPGNLRDIMNQVLETERRAQADLVLARKDADVMRIKSEAESATVRQKLEAEKERVQLMADAEFERARLKRDLEIADAKAVSANPQLLRLRELQTLKEIAQSGAKVFIGLETNAIRVPSITSE